MKSYDKSAESSLNTTKSDSLVKLGGSFDLQSVSEALRNDKEIVLAAVQQNGSALSFASEDLKLAFIKEFNEASTTLGNLVPDEYHDNNLKRMRVLLCHQNKVPCCLDQLS
jgi:hypothetical protein